MSGRRGNHEGSQPYHRKDGRWQVGLFYVDPATGEQKRTTVTAKTRPFVPAAVLTRLFVCKLNTAKFERDWPSTAVNLPPIARYLPSGEAATASTTLLSEPPVTEWTKFVSSTPVRISYAKMLLRVTLPTPPTATPAGRACENVPTA